MENTSGSGVVRKAGAILALLNGLLAVGAAGLGIRILLRAGSGLREAGANEEFGAGMFVAASGMAMILIGLVLAGLSLCCVLVMRRARAAGRPGMLGTTLLVVAAAPPVGAGILLALALSGPR